ncbi:MAG: helix-turn-helix transcriptional regulator [Verrucomicrobiota bacterium]
MNMADPTASLKSRPPLSRMLAIHGLLQNEKYPNRNHLAQELETSSKTIQRDIDFMRDRLNLPIEYDERKYGYYYTQPVQNFPTIQVTESELMALFVAQKALSIYKGTSFEHPLTAAFQKLVRGLKDTVSFPIEALDSALSFSMTGMDVVDAEIFQSLAHAALHSKEIQFKYRGIKDEQYRLRAAHPYHLACIEKQWYLFAFDLDRQDMRTFALARMKDAHVTERKFLRPSEFSLSEHLADSFGVRTNSGKYKIRVWFDAAAAKLIRERNWHASQKIKELKKGEIELQMTLGSLTEVKRWILSWGAHARALGPMELLERLRQDARKMSEYYLMIK